MAFPCSIRIDFIHNFDFFSEFREARQVEATTDFPDTTTDIVSVNNGSSIMTNSALQQFEDEKEDDEQDDTAHRKPEKPSNNHENQVFVETNPSNNIIIEAPVITTIIGGHPYPGSYCL